MKRLLGAAMLATLLAGPSTALAAETMQTVEGRVQSVDPAGRTVTLLGGMTLTIPPNISAEPLHSNEKVTVTYTTGKDGRKELVAFWIESDGTGRNS